MIWFVNAGKSAHLLNCRHIIGESNVPIHIGVQCSVGRVSKSVFGALKGMCDKVFIVVLGYTQYLLAHIIGHGEVLECGCDEHNTKQKNEDLRILL